MTARAVLPRLGLGLTILGAALWLAFNRGRLDPSQIEGMAPGTIIYTWLGYAGREAIAGNDAAIRYGLIALGLLAVVAFLPRLFRRLREKEVRWIEVSDLAGRLKEPEVSVIDVRGLDEFRGPLGHIAGALNLPVAELPSQLMKLSELATQRLVLVCRTAKRSANAAALLEEAGFHDVLVLRGGMVRWNEMGLPVQDRSSQLQA